MKFGCNLLSPIPTDFNDSPLEKGCKTWYTLRWVKRQLKIHGKT